MTPAWTDKMPSLEEVEKHKKKHSIGCWIVYEINPRIADAGPQILKLRVNGNRIELRNGYSFWQPLDECRWADKCKYLPVSNEGLPVTEENA